MNFNDHFGLEGQHAFLSASKYHWVNYDEEKLVNTYLKFQAIQRGTRLHQLASDCITLGVKLPRSRKAFDMYVNDAIGYRMTPEQILYYSQNAFGTADSICFRKKQLRIHDLKTGVSPTSMRQLEVYAALFCLEYDTKPQDISIELRIYQLDEVVVHVPDPEAILHVMDRVIVFDRRIEQLKSEG